MLIRLIRCLQGYVVIRVCGYAPERFLNLCSNNGILVWDIVNRHTCYEMKMSLRGFRSIRPFVRKTKTKIMIIEKHGLPFFIFRNRKRKAFFLGIVLCALLLYVMSLFIWDIRIEGCEHYTEDLLMDFLEENGVMHGMSKKRVDGEEIQFLLRNNYPKITWASVSMEGTRLLVKIRENTVTGEEKDQEDRDVPSDLLSPEDGAVAEMIVRQGTPVKEIGDTVHKGEILVSGRLEILNDSKEVARYEYCKSDADVWVEYQKEYTCSINRSFMHRIYSGKEKKGFFLKLLSREWSFVKAPEKFLLYDTLTVQKQLRMLDNFYLPVFYGSVCYREYEMKEDQYSDEELKKLLLERKQQDFGDLEKKGVQIIKNDVKIQIGKSRGSISGTLLLRRKADEFSPTVLMEDPDTADGTPMDG